MKFDEGVGEIVEKTWGKRQKKTGEINEKR
jgi:hypothetical protein